MSLSPKPPTLDTPRAYSLCFPPPRPGSALPPPPPRSGLPESAPRTLCPAEKKPPRLRGSAPVFSAAARDPGEGLASPGLRAVPGGRRFGGFCPPLSCPPPSSQVKAGAGGGAPRKARCQQHPEQHPEQHPSCPWACIGIHHVHWRALARIGIHWHPWACIGVHPWACIGVHPWAWLQWRGCMGWQRRPPPRPRVPAWTADSGPGQVARALRRRLPPGRRPAPVPEAKVTGRPHGVLTWVPARKPRNPRFGFFSYSLSIMETWSPCHGVSEGGEGRPKDVAQPSSSVLRPVADNVSLTVSA